MAKGSTLAVVQLVKEFPLVMELDIHHSTHKILSLDTVLV